ncbi:MAG: type II secretion system F family protein [Chthoniobacterales bacterium]|nr:type II secretion system F family protein [Chthoniobacterales bacterium]
MLRHYAENPGQLWTFLLQFSIFGLIITVWCGIVTVWYLKRARREEELHARLDVHDHGAGKERVLRLWHDGGTAETYVPGDAKLTLGEKLELVRQDAGWTMPMPRALVFLGLTILIAPIASAYIFKNPLPGIVLGVLIGIGFRANLARCLNKRTQLYEKQLIDALDLGGRSLRAGHPLSGAFRLIAEEIDAPIGTVFAEIVEQESLGVGVQDALKQAADRSRSADMRIFAAAVIIQLRSGGNLADMMERVAWVIRERGRLQRRARVLTAEAQLSKWVLLGMPAALFVIMNIMNSRYMQPFFTDWRGHVMIAAAFASMVLGGIVMNRMAKLTY